MNEPEIKPLPCDWPQCECGYQCERNDKHEDWIRESAVIEHQLPGHSETMAGLNSLTVRKTRDRT